MLQLLAHNAGAIELICYRLILSATDAASSKPGDCLLARAGSSCDSSLTPLAVNDPIVAASSPKRCAGRWSRG